MSVDTPAFARLQARRPLLLAGAAVAVFAAWIATGLGGSTCARSVDDLGTAAAAIIAATACARTAMRQSGRLRLVWALLAVACAAWSLGELTWSFYDLTRGEVPSPSWADLAYLAALPPAAAALIVHPALRSRAIGQARSLLDGFVLATALFLLTWTLVLEPLRRASGTSVLGGAVNAAYPIGDVVIIFLIVLVIRGTTGGDRLDLWYLLFGLLAITLSDSIFGYLIDTSRYTTGNVIDTGWFAGYLAIALAAYFARPGACPRAARATGLTPAALVGPFIPLLAALCVTAVKVELGHPLDRVSLGLAFTLIILVLIRQVLLVIDLAYPRRLAQADVGQRFLAAIGEPSPERTSGP